jgi:predicted nucleotidyltransferase
MRLTNKEINIIKSQTFKLFEEVQIYLFGSRIDNNKKGGDIDLYIIPKNKKDTFRKKLLLKARLEDLLFKPVDIIVAIDKNRIIEKEAIRGILLNKGGIR